MESPFTMSDRVELSQSPQLQWRPFREGTFQLNFDDVASETQAGQQQGASYAMDHNKSSRVSRQGRPSESQHCMAKGYLLKRVFLKHESQTHKESSCLPQGLCPMMAQQRCWGAGSSTGRPSNLLSCSLQRYEQTYI